MSCILHPKRDPWTLLSALRPLMFAQREWFDDFRDQMKFFSYGREALYEGLRLLDFGQTDNVLIPSFICHVAYEPFRQLGIQVKFYQVLSDLQPDWESVEKLRDSRTRAFMAVNYFGFPQPFSKINEYCKNNNLYYIEDNAHSYLSRYAGRPMGTFGDISILSFRKMAPLLNGAALLVNSAELRRKFPHTVSGYCFRSDVRYVLGRFLSQCDQWFGTRNKILIKSVILWASKYRSRLTTGGSGQARSRCKMSYLSSRLISRSVPGLAAERRELYLEKEYFLKKRYGDCIEAIHKCLPDEVAPFCYPFRFKDKESSLYDLNRSIISWPQPPLELVGKLDYNKVYLASLAK